MNFDLLQIALLLAVVVVVLQQRSNRRLRVEKTRYERAMQALNRTASPRSQAQALKILNEEFTS